MFPPKTMTHAERAIIGRELSRAQATLERARKMADVGGDSRLAKVVGDQVKAIGEAICSVHQTPRTPLAELIP